MSSVELTGSPREDIGRLLMIPTYNELENIESLITEIRGRDFPADILVIDDNSPDGTAQKVIDMQAEFEGLIVMSRPAKTGLGSAYRSGVHWALDKQYQRLFHMDADFSHPPKVLPEIDAKLDESDLVIGSRYVRGGAVKNWGVFRRLLSRTANTTSRWMLGLPVRDCTSGYRGYRRSTLERL
ncbi:MAG: glycosyltransferase, partial [bacterium]